MLDEWLASCDLNINNESVCMRLQPDHTWNNHNLFSERADAKLFLGELDAIFLTAYSAVKRF